MTRVIRLDSVNSTNTYAATVADTLGHGDVVTTRSQTAGRGQRGNSWEAEPGRNLTFSLMLRPEGVRADEQFLVSEAVALGVADVLQRHLPAERISVKWPNDIYAGDRKICGILIENVVSGKGLVRSIAGIGINVNQREFISDAPNPVSMLQLAGHEFDLGTLLAEVTEHILELATRLHTLPGPYAARLWRREGIYPYIDHNRGGIPFSASLTSVSPTGILTLTDTDGISRQYAFKEVSFVL